MKPGKAERLEEKIGIKNLKYSARPKKQKEYEKVFERIESCGKEWEHFVVTSQVKLFFPIIR